LQERREPDLHVRIVLSPRQEHADPPHPLALLRTRRERPCASCAAQKRDELPPSQSIELHSVPTSDTG